MRRDLTTRSIILYMIERLEIGRQLESSSLSKTTLHAKFDLHPTKWAHTQFATLLSFLISLSHCCEREVVNQDKKTVGFKFL